MKIKCVRQSGQPVDLTKQEEFKKEFQSRYDVILENHGQDMKTVHDKLKQLDIELAYKYDTIIKLNHPQTHKAIKAFVDEYGSYMISTHAETGESMMVIMDMGI